MIDNLVRFCSAMLLTALVSTFTFAATDSHRVALSEIPKPLEVASEPTVTNLLLLSMIGEPLLATTRPGGVIEDGTLKASESVVVSRDFRTFRLCLKPDLRFSDGSSVNSADLKATLERVHSGMPSTFGTIKDIKLENMCVLVSLEESHFDYLDTLSSPYTVIVKESKQGFPVSTGSYQITSFSDSRIELTGRAGQVKDLKAIEFVLCKDKACDNDVTIDDWNFTYSTSPSVRERLKSFQAYPIFSSTVILFVINAKNVSWRSRFGFCLSQLAENTLQTLGDAAAGLVAHRTLIPDYYPGAIDVEGATGRTLTCETQKGDPKKINLLYDNPVRVQALAEMFNKNASNLPSLVNVEAASFDEQQRRLLSDELVMAMMAATPEGASGPNAYSSLGFFDGFHGEKPATRFVFKELPDLIGRAIHASTRTEREQSLQKAHRQLLESGVVVPFGIRRPSIQLPKVYQNVEFVNPYSRFPRYDRITLRP